MMTMPLQLIYWIPAATTVVAVVFATIVLSRYRERGGTHLLWWGIGLVLYGVGTLTEALTTILGWNEWVFRTWYVTGALCGGAPLAQGTVYLLLKRRTANVLSVALVLAIGIGALLVFLSPIDHAQVEGHRLSGRVLGWQQVRSISPFINTYAAIFLIGGAIASAMRYRANPGKRHKYIGNIFIAVGAILPGIGGAFTRFGHVEVLYVTEFVGLLLIYVGFRYNVSERPTVPPTIPTQEPSRMRRTSIAVALLFALVVPGASAAQESGPRAGSWGAETNLQNDVSVLRFRSNTSAWIVGFSGFFLKHDEEDDTFETEVTNLTLRLGLRSYRSPATRLRPFFTLAALLGYTNADGFSSPPWQFGAQFEYGGAYFFTPHVSLGASFDVRGVYGTGTREQPGGPEVRITEIIATTGLRFLGAVYF